MKLAVAVGSQRQGAVHSHTKRALAAAGALWAAPEQLIQVGILAVTTIGWPGAFAAICWIKETIAKRQQQDSRR